MSSMVLRSSANDGRSSGFLFQQAFMTLYLKKKRKQDLINIDWLWQRWITYHMDTEKQVYFLQYT